MIKNILIIEDELMSAKLLERIMIKEQWVGHIAVTGKSAMEQLETIQCDAILLDIMLPDMDGLEILKWVRSNPVLRHIPVILVTAKNDEIDVILGLELGADDYINKPYRKKELIARLKAVFRRMERDRDYKGQVLQVGNLQIEPQTHKVTKDGQKIDLTPKEYQLLLLLLSNPNRIYSRDELLDKVWQDEVAYETRTVDVHVRRLRMKVEEDPTHPKWIETVRGYGYRYNK